MKIFSSPLLILFCLALSCPTAISHHNVTETNNRANTAAIKQLVSEALEYNGWINEPDYQERLGSMYGGKLLTEIINSVKQFRSVPTDWLTLTFVSDCHIVYHDGNNALVLALFYDQNPDGTKADHHAALLTLHNTAAGWRIMKMKIIWPPPQ